MMSVKVSWQIFENGLVKTISAIPHNLHANFHKMNTKSFSLIGEPISYIKSVNESYLELMNKNSHCYSIQSSTA